MMLMYERCYLNYHPNLYAVFYLLVFGLRHTDFTPPCSRSQQVAVSSDKPAVHNVPKCQTKLTRSTFKWILMMLMLLEAVW